MVLDAEMRDRVVATCAVAEEAVAIAMHLNGEASTARLVHGAWMAGVERRTAPRSIGVSAAPILEAPRLQA